MAGSSSADQGWNKKRSAVEDAPGQPPVKIGTSVYTPAKKTVTRTVQKGSSTGGRSSGGRRVAGLGGATPSPSGRKGLVADVGRSTRTPRAATPASRESGLRGLSAGRFGTPTDADLDVLPAPPRPPPASHHSSSGTGTPEPACSPGFFPSDAFESENMAGGVVDNALKTAAGVPKRAAGVLHSIVGWLQSNKREVALLETVRHDALPPDDAKCVHCRFVRGLEESEAGKAEYRCIECDGGVAWFCASCVKATQG
ncbi:unnamed protein product [Peniophora sp. CBMAI 1063]|nr:unnamed protein product [Peniophora sp. CBMAI 1063]